MYYKLGQACDTTCGSFALLQNRGNVVTIWVASLLQIRASAAINWGSYYKVEQLLL